MLLMLFGRFLCYIVCKLINDIFCWLLVYFFVIVIGKDEVVDEKIYIFGKIYSKL